MFLKRVGLEIAKGTRRSTTQITIQMNKLLLTASLALGLVPGLFADTLVLTSLNGGAAAGSTLVNFDSFTLGNTTQSDGPLTVDFSGSAEVVNGSVQNSYAAPFLSGGNGTGFGSPNQPDGQDTTNYLTSGIGNLTFSFSSGQKYLGLLWGSVDDYNTLEFWSGGSLISSFTGLDVTASANGDRGASGTYYVYVNDLDGSFDKVVAKSTTNAFEIDNVSYDTRSHIPDSGATIALVGAALLGLAALRRKL
jgi:hypothetical protein